MAWYHRVLNTIRAKRLSKDIEREVAFHIAERADELRSFGFSEEEAQYEARRRFGNRAMQRERVREADITIWLDSTLADVRYALRALRQSPIFAVVAVSSIALGIGANVAIYSLVDAVSIRSLPVPNPEELLQIGVAHRGEGGFVGVAPDDQRFSNPLWEALREAQNGFSGAAAYGNLRANLADSGEARYAVGAFVSGDYFRLFGVVPELGRVFSARDDVRGCPPTAVLSDDFWRTEFAGDPRIVGRRLSLDGKSFEIIGVAAKRFAGPIVGVAPKMLIPLCAEPVLRGERSRLDARSDWWLTVIGRRPSGVDPRQIGARLQAIAPELYAATLPPSAGTAQRNAYLSHTFSLGDAHRGLSDLRDRFQSALIALMAFVVIVILIACANVANLMLARATVRRREFAVRLALGAERARLARQLLTESTLIAVLGAASGLLIAQWGASALVGTIALPQGKVELDLTLNVRMIAFTAGIASLTVILFGVLPSWRATRVAPLAAMSGMRSVAEGASRFTLGKALVGAQVALSFVLLVAAGLLVGSLRRLSTESLGFRADHVLIVKADLRQAGIPSEQLVAYETRVLETLRTIPGVADASQSYVVPVGGDRWNDVVVVDGYTPRDPDDAQILFNRVSTRYFATLGTRLLAGRDFNAEDIPSGARAAVVNDAFVRRFLPTSNAIGRQFHTRVRDTLSSPLTIVGVVENTKYESIREESTPIVYLAMSQGAARPTMIVELRAVGDPAALAPAVRNAMHRENPRIVIELETLSDQLGRSISRERLLAALSAVFGAVALVLAILGLYGVMAYSVARRANEMGVRVALGADRARIVRLVLGDVGRVVVSGAAVGVLIAMGAGRVVGTFLFRTKPTDPGVLLAATTLLMLVAAVAGLVPAIRAARADPVATLRE